MEPVAIQNHGRTEYVLMSIKEYEKVANVQKPRRAGYAEHVFKGVDVDALLSTPIPGIEEYMPE